MGGGVLKVCGVSLSVSGATGCVTGWGIVADTEVDRLKQPGETAGARRRFRGRGWDGVLRICGLFLGPWGALFCV